MTATLDITPLGGLGEIGLNCLALEWDGQILVVDAGLMFPDPTQLGVDLIIPDFSHLLNKKDQIVGIVLTHGHEDHIGALAFLLKSVKVPVYGTRLTLALAKERLWECQIRDYEFIQIKAQDHLTLGPFEIEFISVSHSIIDGVALAVTTPVGVIIHTGDFKLDLMATQENRLDLYKFAEYGEKGVLALLSDSTNAEVPGQSVSESEVGKALTEIFQKAPGRIILACFASSVARLKRVAEAAQAAGRKLLFDGRSMVNNVRLAQELGYLCLPPEDTVNIHEAEGLPDRKVAVVVTGSQGEPLSALARMAMGEHRHIKARSGDTIIFSARIIPGNERAIGHLVNLFQGLGAEVVDQRRQKVHASGHGQADELKLMLNLTRPKFFTPIHGEIRHLVKHAELAREQGLPPENIYLITNGQRLTLTSQGEARLGEPIVTGRLVVDGGRLGSPLDPVFRSRTRIAETGLAVITFILEPENETAQPRLLAPPQVALFGIHYENEPDLTLEAARTALLTWRLFLQDRFAGPFTPDEETRLIEAIKREIRRLFKVAIQRKPLTHIQLIQVTDPASPTLINLTNGLENSAIDPVTLTDDLALTAPLVSDPLVT
ncbi:MAG: ribonuclease J [Deltaproteobacteria bacterium]|jgi:ribonuclease J|nr:ribonuclease J [Deltaproteobacteria bacterium]